MSWDAYVSALLQDGKVDDAALCGYLPSQEATWASGRSLNAITVEEIQKLVGKDRGELATNGVTLSGIKCTVVRDEMETEIKDNEAPFIDLRMKDGSNTAICVSKAKTVLIIVKGKPQTPGYFAHEKATEMAKHLMKCNF